MDQAFTSEAPVTATDFSDATPRATRADDGLAVALAAARQALLDRRRPDGHWCGELEGDTILESEYVLTLHFLGRADGERARRMAATLRRRQLPGGGWAIYPGGPPEVSASVKAYFVLKLVGVSPEEPDMVRARETILRLGGIEATNTFTRIYLAIFGQYPWNRCPAVPPEMVLLPRWFPFNLYEMSSWSRAIFVPLSIIWALPPSRPVPASAALAELWAERPPKGAPRSLWGRFFDVVDRALKICERLRIRPLRRRALARAESWILARIEKSDGLGAIFPPIVNTIFALDCLGYATDSPALASQIAELERLVIDDPDDARVQPCFSPVWDTAQAVNTLLEAGLPADDPAIVEAVGWLLDHEVRELGDWAVKCPGVEPGGWYFEYANEFYPDCDDTAEVLTALAKASRDNPELAERAAGAIERGLAWLLAMQNRDGGWSSFDKACDRKFLTQVPFADHNAMIDPSTADITGRTLETLSALGHDRSFPAARRAIRFLFAEQEADGSWYGRWGCNHLYGTWLAVTGLRLVGIDTDQDWARRAVAWLASCQNPDGGWGELPLSYDDPATRGCGPSTAAQTAWALLTLEAAGAAGSAAATRGLAHLLATQNEDGAWFDEPWTGTGFPKVFYLRYHLYASYFPLLALAVYHRLGSEAPSEGSAAGEEL